MVNKKLPLIAIALVVFLGVMFLLGKLVGTRFSTIVSGPGVLAPNVLSAREDAVTGPTARLTKESGVVSYKLPDANEFQQLDQDEVDLPTGTEVKTGPSSFAHVIFPDNSLMSLSTETQVTLNFEANTIKIFQLFGNTWHRVERVIRGSSYEVETPNTLATVRGTEFNVGVLPNNESEIYVVESVVDVSKIAKDQNGEMTLLETEKVTKDKHITVPASDSAKKMQMITMSPAKKNTDWFKRNEKLTEVIKEAERIEEQKRTTLPSQSQEKDTVKQSDDEQEQEKIRDEIKNTVRFNIMKTIKENEEMKKVDRQFPTNTPVQVNSKKDVQKENDKDVRDLKKEENNNRIENSEKTSKEEKSSVLGAKTETTPLTTQVPTPTFTPTPTLTPTDTPVPTTFTVVIVKLSEKADPDKVFDTAKRLNPDLEYPKSESMIGLVVLKRVSEKDARHASEVLGDVGAQVELQ